MSIGHLAEVERGDKHAGSETLAAICLALDVPQSIIISETADRLEIEELQEQGVAA